MEEALGAELRKNLDGLLDRGRLSGKAVFAFGHCNATEAMLDHLLDRGVRPAAILDNNPAKQTLVYRGIPVRPPAEVLLAAPNAAAVLIASRAYAPMADQLRRLRYGGEVRKILDYNTFAEHSLSGETFVRKRDRALRGMKRLRDIRTAHPRRYLVVCPQNALGDVCHAMAYLPAYQEKNAIGEVVVVVLGAGCRQVAELFEMQYVVTLDRPAMDELTQAVLFAREGDCIIAHHDIPYTDNIIRYLDRRFLSFADYYRFAVYGLDRDARPVPPRGQADFAGAGRVKKGRSVILAPYAKSVVNMPPAFWEDLARDFMARGLRPHTSVTGTEKPVNGTPPLSIPLNQMLAAAEWAGCFAGLRSGLCDLVADARCRKIVVFPDCAYSTTRVKVDEFFDLPGWEKIVGGEHLSTVEFSRKSG